MENHAVWVLRNEIALLLAEEERWENQIVQANENIAKYNELRDVAFHKRAALQDAIFAIEDHLVELAPLATAAEESTNEPSRYTYLNAKGVIPADPNAPKPEELIRRLRGGG